MSFANASSRSNSSSGGGGSSRSAGGNTAGRSAGVGASNCGAMRPSGAFSTPSAAYRSTASGTRSMSMAYIWSTKSCVKSFFKSAPEPSCRHILGRSASAATSGSWSYSLTSGSSASSAYSDRSEPGLSQRIQKSRTVALSSRSSHSSLAIRPDPNTHTFPRPSPLFGLPAHSAAVGRCVGTAILPVLSTGTAGFCAFSVAQNGTTKRTGASVGDRRAPCAASRDASPTASASDVPSAPGASFSRPAARFARARSTKRRTARFRTPSVTSVSLGCAYAAPPGSARTAASALTEMPYSSSR